MYALPYLGGKAAQGPSAGRRIAALLPTDTYAYVEPFAGMLGVLLQRDPAPVEVANDLDRRIFNWWRVLVNSPDELAQRISNTLYHRAAYEDARDLVDSSDAMTSAVAVAIALYQGYTSSLEGRRTWMLTYSSSDSKTIAWNKLPERIQHLAERVKSVQFECRPAEEIADVASRYEDCLMYLDPPYLSAKKHTNSAYGCEFAAVGEMTEILRSAKCRVAISGYNDDWEHLGWERTTFNTHVGVLGEQHQSNRDYKLRRVDVLWTNFEPKIVEQQELQL